MKIIKARCVKHDKWFSIAVDEQDRIVNFEDTDADAAKARQTQVKGTSFQVGDILRPCMKCGSRKAGCCDHVQEWNLCGKQFFYQCLFCDQLRISREAANSRYSEYVGQSNIVGAELDKYGNPQGEKYDLAKRDGFKGYRIVILNLCPEEIINLLNQPGPVLRDKGFEVLEYKPGDTSGIIRWDGIDPVRLKSVLGPKTQLWILSTTKGYFDNKSAAVVEEFYMNGGGVYIWGDNDPYHVDADFLGKKLAGVTMSGDYLGQHTIGVKNNNSNSGIIAGHPIATGIARFYEGVTIAAIKTNAQVLPLVYSSDGKVVTAYSESYGSRLLLDGGFTRLYCEWDSAGTGRFVANCAAWLANANDGGEEAFT